MINHEESTDLLDATMAALEADISTIVPQNSAGVIDQWLAQLHQSENAGAISDTLEGVKTQLMSNQPNAAELSQLLDTLADQTFEFSTRVGSEGDMAVRLDALSSALRSLAGQIGHS